MAYDADLRREIADLIRDNEEAIADESIRDFFGYFQGMDFPPLPREEQERWTKQELDEIIYALETNDTSRQNYVSFYGFIVTESSPNVYSIGNFVESRLHFARVILPHIVSHSLSDARQSRDMVNCFEELLLRIIRENLERFAQTEFAPGSLLKYARAHPARQLDAEVGTFPEKQQTRTDGSALTDREMDVLKCIVDGKANKEIAAELGISIPTVKNHIGHILDKLHLGNRTELAVWGLRNL